MKLVALAVAGVMLLGLPLAMGWQHLRYLDARRGPVQDRQDLVYPSSTLHVVSFLRAAAGADVMADLRALRDAVESAGAKLVYAGRAASFGLASEQLGEADWDAVILVQHPSREAYDELTASTGYRAALGRFEAAYSHGMHRPVLLNLGIPMALLALRAVQIASFQPSHYPLVPADPGAIDARARTSGERGARLAALRDVNPDAVVIVNLLKGGTDEQRAADRSYGLKMAGAFAEGAHGPMHMGSAVRLEGDADFDLVALVYYPGIDYMQRLMESRFFNDIVGDKQPGDTLAVPTVPVLSAL